MRVFHIKFDIRVPDDNATADQVIEWARYHCHDNGYLSIFNPLINDEPELILGTFKCEED